MNDFLESKAGGDHPGHRLLQLVLSIHAVSLAFLYWRLRWEGVENVPEGPAVLTPNHMSLLDGAMVCVPVFLHQRCRLIQHVAAKDQFDGPFGAYLRLYAAIPINPRKPGGHAVRKMIRAFEKGRLVGIFPEGGISRTGRLRPFHAGAAWIALRAGVPLVPVTINGTFAVWPRSRRFPSPGPLEVIYHPPIPCHEMRGAWRDREQVERVRRRMEEAVASRYLVPDNRPAQEEDSSDAPSSQSA